jgi:hypothetical protein
MCNIQHLSPISFLDQSYQAQTEEEEAVEVEVEVGGYIATTSIHRPSFSLCCCTLRRLGSITPWLRRVLQTMTNALQKPIAYTKEWLYEYKCHRWHEPSTNDYKIMDIPWSITLQLSHRALVIISQVVCYGVILYICRTYRKSINVCMVVGLTTFV